MIAREFPFSLPHSGNLPYLCAKKVKFGAAFDRFRKDKSGVGKDFMKLIESMLENDMNGRIGIVEALREFDRIMSRT